MGHKRKRCSNWLREILVPLSLLGAVAALLLPLPGALLDFLLVAQMLLALLLLGSALYVPDPIRLSALPSILLLTTLYRLALNVSTTRLILGSGEAGKVIEAFGSVVISGNLVVGVCVFLIITLIQFVVIAKGSERVAEVSARFTLDALPGKQMSIDADLRSGSIDAGEARRRRQELQVESRFYGALDGAMKFVKGDAIAGLVITMVNVAGGLAVGLFLHKLDWSAALSKYTLLTVGDGLLSQLPAVLNSLAAGMIVTRVARGDQSSLAAEVCQQLADAKKAQVLAGLAALGLALLPGMPFLPFVAAAIVLLGCSAVSTGSSVEGPAANRQLFQPKVPAVLEIRLSRALLKQIIEREDASAAANAFQARVYADYGLIMPQPDITAMEGNTPGYQICIRGVCAAQVETPGGEDCLFEQILNRARELVAQQPVDFLDDIMTRRILDNFEGLAPELVAAVVPEVVTVTQLTEVLKALIEEGLSVRNFDVIMQAVAESKPKVGDGRRLVAEVRVGLKRLISQRFSGGGAIDAITVDPLLDLAFARGERDGESLSLENLELFLRGARRHANKTLPLICSKAARRLMRDCLKMNGIDLYVIAHEEVMGGLELIERGQIDVPDEAQRSDLLAALAA